MSLVEKVALITGASSGIGRHLAKVLASEGSQVAVAARREPELKTLVSEIQRDHGPDAARSVRLDVSDGQSIQHAVLQVQEMYGKIDILINNAGIASEKPTLHTSLEEYDQLMQVNVRGPWLLSKCVAQQWIEQTHPGCIINIGSVAGVTASSALTLYGTSKAALHHLTKSLAAEWARFNIRVNAIAPGYILTDMNASFFSESPLAKRVFQRIPQRRIGALDELDALVKLLVNDVAASYMTGAVIPIDGGHTCAGL